MFYPILVGHDSFSPQFPASFFLTNSFPVAAEQPLLFGGLEGA
jgi:hypothetical protein